jgi:hypothetical protein
MRTILRRFGNRYGISLGVIIVVAVIVAVAKVVGGPPQHSLTYATAPTLGSVSAPTYPSPTASASVPVLHSPHPPITGSGRARPQTVAVKFARAWLHHQGITADAWFHQVTAFTTSDLADQLKDAEPASVPAQRITGAATVVDDTAILCTVRIPTDTGTLVLTMVSSSGSWLVDGIDWDWR